MTLSTITHLRPLELRLVVLSYKTVPKLVIGVPLGDVTVALRRFVASHGLERSVDQAVEVNICAPLLQPRAGLEDRQPRQLLAGELREPVVEHLVVSCWGALLRVASG